MGGLNWIAEIDNSGPFAPLGELKKIFESIPEEERNHPKAAWLDGFIMGREMYEN